MMKVHTRLALAATVAGLVSMPALATTGVVQKAKISMTHARQIALNAQPGGKIIHEELEKERGGSGLRYSFDIKQGTKTVEVGVDAMTGKVLENGPESASKESHEKD